MFRFTSTLRTVSKHSFFIAKNGPYRFPMMKIRAISTNSDSLRSYQVVVAATRDMGIGKDGKLPWNLQSDLNFFKQLTSTTSDLAKMNAVVMGRKTWDSIPIKFRPLPDRLNVVLTRSQRVDFNADNVVVCSSLASALKVLAQEPYCSSIETVFVIGGGQVLRDALNGPGCDAIHITEIDTTIECDTHIPAINLSFFRVWYSSPPMEENNVRFCFSTYVRDAGNRKLNDDFNSNKFEGKNFTFLPKMIFEQRDQYGLPKAVEDMI